MSRLKTFTFWIFIVLAAGAGVYGYFSLKNNKKPRLQALSVLPGQCLFYLNTYDLSDLNQKINSHSLIADKLRAFGEIDALCATLEVFDSLFHTNEALEELFDHNPVHFAAYGQEQGWIATCNIKQLGRQDDIGQRLSEVLGAVKNKAGLTEFRLGKQLYFLYLQEGVLTLSNLQTLIIQAFDKKTPRLESEPSFIAFKNTLSEQSLLSLYVNHGLYGKSPATTHLNLSQVSGSGCSAGNIDIQPSQVKINGFIQPGEADVISLFKDQEAQPTEYLTGGLPLNTRYFKAYGFSSYPELRVEFPISNTHIKYWMKANERSLYNTEDDFNSNLGNVLIDFETRFPEGRFLLAEAQDTIKAAENLKFMSDTLLYRDSLLIYCLNDSLSQPFQLFHALSGTATNFALLFRSHMYFSETAEALVQLAASLKNGQLLALNTSFVSYKNQHFPERFNYLVYGAPNQMKERIPAVFNFPAGGTEDPFQNFRHCSFAVSQQAGAFKFRFHLMNETSQQDREQNVLWTLTLDNPGSSGAFGFVNHTTGENEIVIQDEQNVLYLINAKGTVLWKKALNEKILSAVHMVDIYKNNKYQLLFNTENYLHLIDRNGKYVEQYPVKLPAEASAPISLFDYDSNKDYRIFIPCRNRQIYNFSIHGTLQDKFAVVRTEDEVRLPVQYVKVGASDYLVALDKEGKIYTFSRKGAGRIGLRNRTTVNCKAFYTDASKSVSNTYLVYVDERNGLISKISFEDKKEIVKLGFPGNGITHVKFALIDNNRNMDLILSGDHTLQAYNFSGNLIVEKNSELSLGLSDFYSDESHNIFYALNEERSQLCVFDQLNSRTRMLKATAMPLISNLFRDNKKYLIVTNGSELNCVPLN